MKSLTTKTTRGGLGKKLSDTIKIIAQYISNRYEPMWGLWHGANDEKNFLLFKKYLSNCTLVGTSRTIESEKDNILHRDYSLQYDDFINRFDFIYCDIFADIPDINETFHVWRKQLIVNGIMIFDLPKDYETHVLIKLFRDYMVIVDILSFAKNKILIMDMKKNE